MSKDFTKTSHHANTVAF